MIYNVQALRAFAAGIVIFVHMVTLLSPLGIRQDDLAFGEAGVDLFFVISGFVMVHTMKRRPLTSGAFFLNRVIRVVPLYWLLTLTVFAIALVAPSLMGATRASPIELIESLSFVPFVKSNGLIQPVLFVGWTLNYEMFFYLIFALGILLCRGSLRGTVAFATAAMLALAVGGAIWTPDAVPLRFFTSPLMLEFALGMILGLTGVGRWKVPGGLAVAIACMGLVLLATAGFVMPGMPRLVRCGLVSLVILWAALVAEERGHVARQPLLQLIGAASYALYLTHPFPLQALGKVSQRIGSAPLAIALTPVAILLAVVVAIACHRWIELPMTKRLRRMFDHDVPEVDKHEPSAGVAVGIAK